MPKAKKLEIEGVVGGAYYGRVMEGGAREGESLLAFVMRLASLEEGRKRLRTQCGEAGDVGAALTQLGIRHNNHSAMIRKLGFLREELEAVARAGGRVGLPAIRCRP